MKKSHLIYLCVTPILFLSSIVAAFGSGKILIFSIPQGGVVNDQTELKEPAIFVDDEAPSYLKNDLLNPSNNTNADLLNDILPRNLVNRSTFNVNDNNSYRFPAPSPTSNLSEFGFSSKVSFLYESSILGKYSQNKTGLGFVPYEEMSTTYSSKATQSSQASSNPLLSELYDGGFECDDPELATRLKLNIDKIVTELLEEPVRNGAHFIPSEKNGGSYGFVNQPNKRVIIAWNGRNDNTGLETLVLSTDLNVVYPRGAAVLSVMPLPGKPLKVQRVDPNIFDRAKSIFFSRTGLPSTGPYLPEDSYVVIGSHNIFIWKLDSVTDFCEQVMRYISAKYRDNAAPWLDPETLRIVEYYIQRGFHYFAFDLTEVRPQEEGSNTRTETIAYTFRSKFAYYPLVINRIGGTDDYSTEDVILMTPAGLNLSFTGAIRDLVPTGKPSLGEFQAELVQGKAVDFRIDEVRNIDPTLDVFDPRTQGVTVRNIKFTKSLIQYTRDFDVVLPRPKEGSNTSGSNSRKPK